LKNIKFVVSKVFGAIIELYNQNEGFVFATLRGKHRLNKGEEKSHIVVGDLVLCSKLNLSDEWSITQILERKNSIVRKSGYNELQILCSNVDFILILASLIDPETKIGFIDRILASAYFSKIQPLIVFTKRDLVEEEEYLEKMNVYQALGYSVFCISNETKEGIEDLKKVLLDKTSFLVGNSGVGKSSFLNHFTEKKLQKVNLISETTKKGKHTTTNSFLYPLNPTTNIIDSPGIKEWGLLHLSKSDILESFPELINFKTECKHNQCCDASTECFIVRNIENVEIDYDRRKSLDAMLHSLDVPYRIRTGNFISGKFKKEKGQYDKKKKMNQLDDSY
jgi:ribosome biogenesis GTPase / thiamine phosphate phosphatase